MLASMEKIISVTDLVRNTASIAREVEAEGTIYRITRGGRGSMVLVDESYFNGWMAALDEMRRPDWREAYAQTTRDITARRGRDLDVVAKELGLEGHSHPTRRAPARRATRTRRKKAR
jgi:PHD/YefM family antitoxin component YafN of YafNO toxin-antitoxin module